MRASRAERRAFRTFIETSENAVGGGEVKPGSDTVGDDPRNHAGGLCGREAVVGILDDETALRADIKTGGSGEVEVRRGFDAWRVAAADGGPEMAGKPEFLQPTVHPLMG